MAEIRLLVAEGPGASPFRSVGGKLVVSRVPVVGELVNYGMDAKGRAADCKVVLVHHAIKVDGSAAADADVYAVRVYFSDELKIVKPTSAWNDPDRGSP